MVTAGDFQKRYDLDMDGDVYQIIEFQHVKPGKGAAFVRTKIRNVISGAVTDKTFNPTDKFPDCIYQSVVRCSICIRTATCITYGYETYEQEPIDSHKLGDNFKFVKENMECKILSYKGNVFGVEPPTFVEWK